eukprot:scaffold47_cov334-Pavlova_lutheri.AAC.21
MEHAKRLNASGSIAPQIEVQVAFGKNGSQGRYRKKCLSRFISKPAVIEVFHVHVRERRLGPHHHVGALDAW